MCAVGRPAKPVICSCRRVHSPPATSAAASSAPKNSRRPRADQPGLDGIFHQENAAERQRHAADPDRPAGAERLLEADHAFGFRRFGGGEGGGTRRRRARARRRLRPARARRAGSAAAAGSVRRPARLRRGGCRHSVGGGAAPGAPATRSSSAAKRRSIARRRSLMLIVLTSATMAMIGNDSSNRPSRTNSIGAPRGRMLGHDKGLR